MSVQVDALILAISGEIASTRNEAALELETALAAATPVDTGEAKRGWRAEVGGAEPTVIGAGTDLAVEVHVENAVDHVTYLAQGSSPQQPSDDWVERTVDQVTDRLGAEVLAREVKL